MKMITPREVEQRLIAAANKVRLANRVAKNAILDSVISDMLDTAKAISSISQSEPPNDDDEITSVSGD